MNNHDAVVVIGGGILQTYLVKEAHALGLKVVCLDGDPGAPAFDEADRHFVCDTYAIQKAQLLMPIIQLTHTVRGVACCGNDVAPTVAACAEAAGVLGIPFDVAQRTHNKWHVRSLLAASPYQPRWLYAEAPSDYCRIEELIDVAISYPCVVKPLSQRASRGVTIVRMPEMLAQAIQKALAYGNEYLIEECLIGTEHSAEAIFDADGMLWFNIVDRMFDYSSGIPIEIGHVNPGVMSSQDYYAIQRMVSEVAAALGVTRGPFKCDVMLTADGPKLLECTARLSGGFDCQVTSPLTGRYPMRTLLKLACGLDYTEESRLRGALPYEINGYAACAAILPAKEGRLLRLPSVPRYREAVWCIKEGDMIHAPQHCAERAGFAFAYGRDYEEAWRMACGDAQQLAEMMRIEEEEL